MHIDCFFKSDIAGFMSLIYMNAKMLKYFQTVFLIQIVNIKA